MLKSVNNLNVTYYHPLLDNYPKYEEFKSQALLINDSLTMAFSQSIEQGMTGLGHSSTYFNINHDFSIS